MIDIATWDWGHSRRWSVITIIRTYVQPGNMYVYHSNCLFIGYLILIHFWNNSFSSATKYYYVFLHKLINISLFLNANTVENFGKFLANTTIWTLATKYVLVLLELVLYIWVLILDSLRNIRIIIYIINFCFHIPVWDRMLLLVL